MLTLEQFIEQQVYSEDVTEEQKQADYGSYVESETKKENLLAEQARLEVERLATIQAEADRIAAESIRIENVRDLVAKATNWDYARISLVCPLESSNYVQAVEEFLSRAGSELIVAEWEAKLAEIDAKALQEKTNQESLKYLSETDWYVTRFAETGVVIPEDVKTKRQLARESVVR